MSRVELLEYLADYWEKAYLPEKTAEKALAFIAGIKRKPKVTKPNLKTLWKMKKLLFRTITFYLFEVPKEHRKAFFTILKTAAQKADYLLPKIIYLYTNYLMDYKRTTHDIKIAREHANWEKHNTDKIKQANRKTPIAKPIREHYNEIFKEAYSIVQPIIPHKESLYKTINEAMIDYNDRFGESIQQFDNFEKENLKNACLRVMEANKTEKDNSEKMPASPPAGFSREVLDVLDNTLRFQNINN